MKNLFKTPLILIAIMFIAFQSCEKKDLFDNSDSVLEELKYDLVDLDLKTHDQNINNLINISYNEDDKKMNEYFYALAESLTDLVKDPKFNQDVINYAKQRDDAAASLITLLNNKNYADKVSIELTDKGFSFEKIANNFTYNNGKYTEKYIPCIFIPNLETCNPELQPILSPNIELNADLDEKYENCIIAWYFTKEGERKEIIINEEDALKTKNPIFIIANAEENFTKGNSLVETEFIENKSTKGIAFSTNEYRINYRYEGSGDSEFAISAGRIVATGSAYNILRKDNGDYVSTKVITSVDKDDISKDLSQWEQFSSNYTPYNENFIFYNTYERDWNNTDKSLGHAVSQNGGNLYLYGKRKYESEWYAWDPETLSSHEVDIEYIENSWAIWYTSLKTKLRFWKIVY